MSTPLNPTEPALLDAAAQSHGRQRRGKRTPARLIAAAVTLPFLLLFGLFQIAPLIWVLGNSFIYEDQWSLDNYREILDSAFLQQAFWNSISLSLWSSLLAMLIGVLGAYSLHQVSSRLRDFVIAFCNMTSNFSGVPLAFAFIIILGFNGAFTLLFKSLGWIDDFNLYGQGGLILIYTYFQIPLALLLTYPAFDALDKDWQDAAALLGASRRQYWQRVGLPVLAPAILGTFIILLANAMGAYATAFALTTGNYNLLTIRIASLVSGDIFLEPNLASAISVLLILLLALVTAVNQWLLKRSYHAR